MTGITDVTVLFLNFQVVEEKLYEHWRKNEPRLRQVSPLFSVIFHIKRYCSHETAETVFFVIEFFVE